MSTIQRPGLCASLAFLACLPTAVALAGPDDILYLYGSVPPANAGHQLLLNDTGNLGFSEFRDALIQEGFNPVQMLDDNVTLDSAALSNYGVLILSSNNRPFTVAEQNAVVSWVNAGGGLLVYSDSQFGFDEGRDSDNDILQHFNMEVMHDNFAGVFTISQYEFQHPITLGITFKGEGVSLVRVLGPPAQILADCQGGNCTLHPTDGPIQPNDAALAIAEVGSGRVAVTFDRNTFFNPPGAGTNINEVNNRQYAKNLVLWLADQIPPIGDGNDTIYIPAATWPATTLGGAMTTSSGYTSDTSSPPDADTDEDAIIDELLYANTTVDGGQDTATYTVTFPNSGQWYAWGRFYYPGAIGSNDPNSFFISVNGFSEKTFGNNKTGTDSFQEWHWDGNGDDEGPATGPQLLGTFAAGTYQITVRNREADPTIGPRLDVLFLTNDSQAVPNDTDALVALSPAADFDRDGDVDSVDFSEVQICLSGTGISQNDPDCDPAKFDGDSDVDPDDVNLFLGCYTGPNVLADPNCLN